LTLSNFVESSFKYLSGVKKKKKKLCINNNYFALIT